MNVYEQYFSSDLCIQHRPAGSAPVDDCFVDVQQWSVLPPACSVPLADMRASPSYQAGLQAYQSSNQACFAGCTPNGGVPCTVECINGAKQFTNECSDLGTLAVLLQRQATLSGGNNQVVITYYDCAPAACLTGNILAPYIEDVSSDYCDNFSPTVVSTCRVTYGITPQVSPSPFPSPSASPSPAPSGGDGGGIAVGVIAGLVALGFVGYHGATRFGFLNRDRVPKAARTVCECSCIRSAAPAPLPAGTSSTGGYGSGFSSSYQSVA